jgi:hypothetical protein
MKRFLLVLLLTPCVGHAQKWRIGLSGGLSGITKPKQAPPAYDDSRVMPGGVGMLSISRVLNRRLELGLDIAAVNLVRKADLVVGNPGAPVGTVKDARLRIGKLALMFTPSLSYRVANWYFGPQVGYFITTKGTTTTANPFEISGPYHYFYNDVRGIVAGAHVGYRRSLVKYLSLCGEARGNYVRGKQIINGISLYGFNMLQLQMTIGASYTL